MKMGEFGFSGKLLGIDYALLPNREWNQKQKHKKQPWGNLECVAFGGATVRFASLETSFHAANHTIPPPPSYEGLPLCPKDKNRSPFQGEKPLKIVICFYEAMPKRQTKGTVLLVCDLTINHNFQGFFAVKRREVFILVAKWKALVRGWRRECVVGGMETCFQ